MGRAAQLLKRDMILSLSKGRKEFVASVEYYILGFVRSFENREYSSRKDRQNLLSAMLNEIGSSRSDERIRRRARRRIKRAAKGKAFGDASKPKAMSEADYIFGFMVDKEGHCAVSVDDGYQKRMEAYLRDLKLLFDVTWTGYKSKDEDSIKREFTDFLVGIFGSEGEEKFAGCYLAEHSKFTCMLTKTEWCLLSGLKGLKLEEVDCGPLVPY